jgi:hypothetical protein
LENSCVYNVAAVIAARMKLLGAEATLESQIRLFSTNRARSKAYVGKPVQKRLLSAKGFSPQWLTGSAAHPEPPLRLD